jgi:phosphatidylglycerol---prolipoprotein diacylglyceryl transferase
MLLSPLHFLFDALAWGAALLVGLYCRKHTALTGYVRADLRLPYQIVLLIGAFLGAGLCGTANLWLQYPNALGHSVLGGIVGGVGLIELFKWRHGITGSTGAVLVLPLAIGIAIGRWGCFLTGLPDYTYGVETTRPWGVDFGDNLSRHPVQLYESFSMTIFAAVAFRLLRRQPAWFRANGFYLFVIIYGAQRFLWEFLKPYAKVLGPFNLFHILCLLLIGYGFFMLRRQKNL